MNTACLRLLIFLPSPLLHPRVLAFSLSLSLCSFLDYPIRTTNFSFPPAWLVFSLSTVAPVPASFLSTIPPSRSALLSHSTSRQLDAFLTTRRTHSEGTTVELYSAAAATIVSSSVRRKGDKQRRCKRAAPFHFCLTSNLLRRRLMKET